MSEDYTNRLKIEGKDVYYLGSIQGQLTVNISGICVLPFVSMKIRRFILKDKLKVTTNELDLEHEPTHFTDRKGATYILLI